MDSFDAYYLSIEMCHTTDDGPRGFTMTQIYLAPSRVAAVANAVHWARSRCGHLSTVGPHWIGAIKVCDHRTGSYNEEWERFETMVMAMFFEWKCDYPGDLDSYVDVFSKTEDKKNDVT